jgi:hypothetical protein
VIQKLSAKLRLFLLPLICLLDYERQRRQLFRKDDSDRPTDDRFDVFSDC